MNIEQIQKVLPHRYPFLLVDRIIEKEDLRIIGIKNVTVNEEFFQGHFPGQPVMPGVLMIEAMAQVAGCLVLSKSECAGKTAYFMAIDKAKFRKPVIPGDQLVIEVNILRHRAKACQAKGEIKVGGDLVAEAELLFSIG